MRINEIPLRSVLYVPADKERALLKSATLDADAVIFDLEDSVAPHAKASAREALRSHFRAHSQAPQLRVIRINGLDTAYGTEDFLAARACRPDAIVLPKVSSQADVLALEDALNETDAPRDIKIWAMIETARGVANCADFCQVLADRDSRLQTLVVGTNDLFKETGVSGPDARRIAAPWLMQIVVAARCGGMAVIDGVHNDHRDAFGFAEHCRTGVAMGFDGVSVIHPDQIAPANHHFSPSADDIDEAERIVAAFDDPRNVGRGVISLEGRMVELLHLDQAKALLRKAAQIRRHTGDRLGST